MLRLKYYYKHSFSETVRNVYHYTNSLEWEDRESSRNGIDTGRDPWEEQALIEYKEDENPFTVLDE